MISTVPSIPELESRMRPGAYSQGGFLGSTESLEVVIAQDDQALRTLGVSHEQIADVLEQVLQCRRPKRQTAEEQLPRIQEKRKEHEIRSEGSRVHSSFHCRQPAGH